MSLIFLLIAWVYLGLNVNPLKAGPFVVSASGILLFTLFTFIKIQIVQTRISKGALPAFFLRPSSLCEHLYLCPAFFMRLVTETLLRSSQNSEDAQSTSDGTSPEFPNPLNNPTQSMKQGPE